MGALIDHLAKHQGTPYLWIEQLAIYSEARSDQCLRSITFRRGINLVWAREPDEGSQYAGIHAAGHGVGKTSLCLLLRYCLGDSTKSIDELREELLAEFPQGGVGVVVHLGNETYSLFRYFNAHRDGLVIQDDTIDALFGERECESYREFEVKLAEKILVNIKPSVIPETGQAILWRHIIAWVARDQGSRFKSYFSWREGEGVGLQRPRQDPPIIMRAVLGLLENSESQLLLTLRNLERELDEAKSIAVILQQAPDLIKKRIESEVRAWLNVPVDMPFYSDDLFKDSIQTLIMQQDAYADSIVQKLDEEERKIDAELLELRIDMRNKQHDYDSVKRDYDLADAARRNDESAYRQLAERRDRLTSLIGLCEHGQVAFQQCQYIQKEIQTISFRDSRDMNALQHDTTDWTTRAAEALQRLEKVESNLEKVKKNVSEKESEVRALKIRRRSAEIEQDRGERLLSELERWEKTLGSQGAGAEYEKALNRCEAIQSEIERERTRLFVLRQSQSDRQKSLSVLTDLFVQELFSNEAFGSLDIREEDRPFKLSMRGGEAYRVLEVLIGDLVCLLDSVSSSSAFPGLLIHDCPREADMGPRPYHHFLSLIAQIEREAYDNNAPFQYIITTTTPPPKTLQEEPFMRLVLNPSEDSGLLFRRRFKSAMQSSVLG